jgi:hypothetical protein
VLLFTLVALLLCLVGVIYAMRDTIIATLTTGNNLAKQKNVQAADIGLRLIRDHIDTLVAVSKLDLAIGATDQAWYRAIDPTGTVPAAPPSPDTAYWSNCTGSGGLAARCATEVLPGIGRNAKFVVQPTGRTNPQGCKVKDSEQTGTANYYDIYVYVEETSQATSAATHTEYLVCVQS